MLCPIGSYIGKRNVAALEVEIAYVCIAVLFNASFIELIRVELDGAEQAAYACNVVVIIDILARIVLHLNRRAVAVDGGDTRGDEIFVVDLLVGRACV